jgi:hypothetical protein
MSSPRPPKKMLPPSPSLCTQQKNWSDRSFSKMVGVTVLFPVPQHVFPLELQTREGGRPDRTRSLVGPTDLRHWSGRPWIHADLSYPPPPLPCIQQKEWSARSFPETVRVAAKVPQQWGCEGRANRSRALSNTPLVFTPKAQFSGSERHAGTKPEPGIGGGNKRYNRWQE